MIELGSLVSALQILPSRDVAKGPETLEKLLVQKSEADLATFKSVGDKAGVNVSMDARCCLALAVSGGLERLGAPGVDTSTPSLKLLFAGENKLNHSFTPLASVGSRPAAHALLASCQRPG